MKTYLLAASRELALDSIVDNDLPGGTIPIDSAQELKGLSDCALYVDPSMEKPWADHRVHAILTHYTTHSPDVEVVWLD